jgi:hypothetical protein
MRTNAKPKPDATDEAYGTRRRDKRFAVDVQASVSVGQRQLRARTRDVSRSGLCLVSLEAIPRDTEIAIELVLTFGEGRVSEPLQVRGEVVWCTALFGAYQLGVKFVQVADDQARYMSMFIGFLDGSLSTGEGESPDDPDDDGHGNRGSNDPDDPFAP